MWDQARKAALTPAQYRSPLARRPYDLRATPRVAVAELRGARHRGRPPAGHGVAVLLKIYAHCIDGQATAANQRTTEALGIRDDEPDPSEEDDDDTEQAS